MFFLMHPDGQGLVEYAVVLVVAVVVLMTILMLVTPTIPDLQATLLSFLKIVQGATAHIQ